MRGAQLLAELTHQPHRLLLLSPALPTRRRHPRCPFVSHDSILIYKIWSSNEPRAFSLRLSPGSPLSPSAASILLSCRYGATRRGWTPCASGWSHPARERCSGPRQRVDSTTPEVCRQWPLGFLHHRRRHSVRRPVSPLWRQRATETTQCLASSPLLTTMGPIARPHFHQSEEAHNDHQPHRCCPRLPDWRA